MIEARAGREFFGTEGAELSIEKNRHLGAQEIALNLVHDAATFAKENLTDDVAILVIKRKLD